MLVLVESIPRLNVPSPESHDVPRLISYECPDFTAPNFPRIGAFRRGLLLQVTFDSSQGPVIGARTRPPTSDPPLGSDCNMRSRTSNNFRLVRPLTWKRMNVCMPLAGVSARTKRPCEFPKLSPGRNLFT